MNRTKIALIALSLFTLAACSSGTAETTGDENAAGGEAPFELSADPVETTEVTAVKSYKFEPQVISVDTGSTVTWSNEDDFPHNVHFFDDSDATHDLPIGDSVEVNFDQPGDFYYECSIHPQQMRGLVVVAD